MSKHSESGGAVPVPVPPEERAELFVELERTAGTGAYVWEPGRLVWSEGFCRLLGLEPGRLEAPGEELFFMRVHPEDRELVREHWESVFREELTPMRFRVVHPSGEIRHLRGHGIATRGPDGAPKRLMGTLVDVTDVQQALEELARANALLKETQDAAGVGMYVYEPETETLAWTEPLYRIYGLEPGAPPSIEVIQRATVPEDLPRHLDWVQRLSAGEPVSPLYVRIRRADGSVRHLESRGRRLADEQGRVRIVGICLDVTARVELEQNLHQAAKMEAVGTLAAGVAHDFNNFLTVILFQLDELRQLADSPLQEPIEDARHAAEQCAHLTEKLLAFARKQPPALRRIELGALVHRVEPLLRRVCSAGVAIALRLPGHAVYVRGEPNQLESLVMNLSLNARDAMRDSGSLTLAVEQLELSATSPALDPGASPGAYARLSVSDTGSGIAPDHLPRIFEPYFSTKMLGQGTGLGLASVYGSVRQHGGWIRVDSALGRGTTFSVFLPLVNAGSGELRAVREPAPLTPLDGRHVLVVEDVDVVRRTVVAGLERAGARVSAVNDGREALHLLTARADVDVVLTDLIMPRVGGLELARQLDTLRPDLPVVFMSGYAEHAIVDSIARERPNQPLLRKPFSVKDLTEAIAAALTHSKRGR